MEDQYTAAFFGPIKTSCYTGRAGWLPLVLAEPTKSTALRHTLGALTLKRLSQHNPMLERESQRLYFSALREIQRDLDRPDHWSAQTLAAIQTLRYYEALAGTSRDTMSIHDTGLLAYLIQGCSCQDQPSSEETSPIILAIFKDLLMSFFDTAKDGLVQNRSLKQLVPILHLAPRIWPYNALDMEQRRVELGMRGIYISTQARILVDAIPETPAPALQAHLTQIQQQLRRIRDEYLGFWLFARMMQRREPVAEEAAFQDLMFQSGFIGVSLLARDFVRAVRARGVATDFRVEPVLVGLASSENFAAVMRKVRQSCEVLGRSTTALGLQRSFEIFLSFMFVQLVASDEEAGEEAASMSEVYQQTCLQITRQYDEEFFRQYRTKRKTGIEKIDHGQTLEIVKRLGSIWTPWVE